MGADSPAGSEPLISVIVPARNAGHTVLRFLTALERQTVPSSRYEALIIDDCSTDATAELVLGSETATLLRLDVHGGAYVARNRGIESARAGVLAFTDADCVPAPDWLERGLAAVEKSDSDLIAGKIDVPLGERPSVAELVDFSSWYDQEDFAARGLAATGNLWVRRAVISRIGGFDESLVSGGDMDFSERAVHSGFTLRYHDDVVVTHFPEGYGHIGKKAYREGREAARRGQPHLKAWIEGGDPKWRAARRERLSVHGYEPGPWKRVGITLVKNLVIRLPMLAGNLVGMAGRARGKPRA